MTAADRPRFVEALQVFGEAYNRAVSGLLIETYWDALGDMPLEALQVAVRQIVRSDEFFPTASRWRAVVVELVRQQAESARQAQAVVHMLEQDVGTWEEKRAKVKTIIAGLAAKMGWTRSEERA